MFWQPLVCIFFLVLSHQWLKPFASSTNLMISIFFFFFRWKSITSRWWIFFNRWWIPLQRGKLRLWNVLVCELHRIAIEYCDCIAIECLHFRLSAWFQIIYNKCITLTFSNHQNSLSIVAGDCWFVKKMSGTESFQEFRISRNPSVVVYVDHFVSKKIAHKWHHYLIWRVYLNQNYALNKLIAGRLTRASITWNSPEKEQGEGKMENVGILPKNKTNNNKKIKTHTLT